jgi:hypothetical protein
MTKSPFLTFQYLLEPEFCDQIARAVRVEPLRSADGVPEATERHYVPLEQEIFEKIKPLIPQIEAHYKIKYRGTEHLIFQQFPATGKQAEPPHCENAVFKRKKWIKVKDRDLTAIIWLKDYQETPPFNQATQVLGGKLEFPVYNFGLQPQKGTMVVYPANERFISLTTAVLVGELQCIRVHIAGGTGEDGQGAWVYQPADYPGDFRSWFADVV